jgi:dephospho-CoA kinase
VIKLGVGGQIGAGKTEVVKYLQKCFRADGYPTQIINADQIAWQLYLPQKPIYKRIVKAFGKEILDFEAQIDRAKLGQLVFSCPQKLQLLNKIIQPALIKKLRQELENPLDSVKILDAALLFTWYLKLPLDLRILVRAPYKAKIERLVKRGYSEADIKKRLKNQASEREMENLADFVLVNDQSLAVLQERTRKLYELIKLYFSDKL